MNALPPRGGRPSSFDAERYNDRHAVECGINILKHYQDSLPDTTSSPLEVSDEWATGITVVQALKCAAVLGATAAGNTAYGHGARLAENILQAAAVEAQGGGMYPTAAELWSELDTVPWPHTESDWVASIMSNSES